MTNEQYLVMSSMFWSLIQQAVFNSGLYPQINPKTYTQWIFHENFGVWIEN